MSMQTEIDVSRLSIPERMRLIHERWKVEKSMRVYVISGGRNCCKIGFSQNVYKRLNQIQSGNALDVRVERVYRVETGDHRRVENGAHRILKKVRMQGEWFRCSIGLACAAIEHMQCGLPSIETINTMLDFERIMRRDGIVFRESYEARVCFAKLMLGQDIDLRKVYRDIIPDFEPSNQLSMSRAVFADHQPGGTKTPGQCRSFWNSARRIGYISTTEEEIPQ